MQRISLSYQLKQGFPRPLIFLGIAVLAALISWYASRMHILSGMRLLIMLRRRMW